jgi:hypothetical protein|nr:MAG TPA_asm: hypothetical protein [Caudoviricetes sp.]
MRMYECTKEFKTTLFEKNELERIKIEIGSIWFVVQKLTDGRYILSNNKIELILCKKLLKSNFEQYG